MSWPYFNEVLFGLISIFLFGAIHKPRGQTRGGAQKATTPIIKIIGGGWGSPPSVHVVQKLEFFMC